MTLGHVVEQMRSKRRANAEKKWTHGDAALCFFAGTLGQVKLMVQIPHGADRATEATFHRKEALHMGSR